MAGKGKKATGKPTGSGEGRSNWSRKNFAPVLLLSIEETPGSGVFKEANDLLDILTNFKVKDALTKATETHFTFRNDDRELAEDPRFLADTVWKYRFGYFDDLSPVFVAVVRNIEPNYADKCTMQVTCYDTSLKASQVSSAKKWGTIKSSEIAKAMAKKHGWRSQIEDSNDVPKKAWIQPSDLNDIQMLRDLAAMIDFEVFVDGDPQTLHFRKKAYDQSPRGTLIYYDDPSEYSYVKSFKPKVTSLGPKTSGVKGTDAEKGKGDKGTSKDATKDNPGLADTDNMYVQTDFTRADDTGHGQVSVVAKPIATAAPAGVNAPKLAAVKRQQILDKCNDASSEHPLTSSLVKGLIYNWQGIEKPLAGKWYVQEVDHEMSGTASSTKVTWKRNATNGKKANLANKNNKDTSGGGDGLAVQTDFTRSDDTGHGAVSVVAVPQPVAR